MGGKRTDIIHFDTEEGAGGDIPVAYIIGDSQGPDAVITAGIHGGEYCAVMAAIKLFAELKPADIKGSVKIITVSDTAAFETRCPELSHSSDNDLNRVFPGKTKGGYSTVLAAKLFDEIKGADYHIDLHCGGIPERSAPFAIYHRGRKGELNDRSHEMAYYSGMPNIVITETEGRWPDKGTCYASVYEGIGIPSVLLQTGGMGIVSAGSVNAQVNGIKNIMRRFGTLRGNLSPVSKPQIYENMEIVRSRSGGIHYRRVSVGDNVKRGQMIGVLTDWFGVPKEKILSPVSGRVLFMTESASMPEKGFVAAIGVSR